MPDIDPEKQFEAKLASELNTAMEALANLLREDILSHPTGDTAAAITANEWLRKIVEAVVLHANEPWDTADGDVARAALAPLKEA